MKCTFLNKEIKQYGRCTICTLQCRLRLGNSIMLPLADWIEDHPQLEEKQYGLDCFTFKVSGKAIRAPEDAEDNTIGTRLAESRAKRKAYKFCETLYRELHYRYGMSSDEAYKDFNKFHELLCKERDHYNELMARV